MSSIALTLKTDPKVSLLPTDNSIANLNIDVPEGSIPSNTVISKCYEAFKKLQPDKYEDCLRAWHGIRMLDETDRHSTAQRMREFKKHTSKLQALINRGAAIYNFETFCISVGGVVSQDINLATNLSSRCLKDVRSHYFAICRPYFALNNVM